VERAGAVLDHGVEDGRRRGSSEQEHEHRAALVENEERVPELEAPATALDAGEVGVGAGGDDGDVGAGREHGGGLHRAGPVPARYIWR